jgi:hypothetical protein
MKETTAIVCKSCHQTGNGNFCARCGQTLLIKRISFKSLLHEVTHFFTHLDKGIRYTLKELVQHPGEMQRAYLEGNRINHQKPFSMYFVCATALGLILYWINIVLITYYQAGSAGEETFFHHYTFTFLLLAIPLSAVITYLFFYSSGYNFAEIGVLQLYTVSVFFLIIILANLLRLIWHQFETRYIELPAILIYNMVTFIHFFKGTKWKIIVKSLLSAAILFLSMAYLQDFIVENYPIK